MIRIAVTVSAALAAAVASTPSHAAVIVWEKASRGNGHAYEFVQASLIGWDESSAMAQAMTFNGVRGHLATITTAQEQAFIESIPNLDPKFFPDWGDMWLGGFQADPDAPPSEGWQWVTGEQWDFTDWFKGDPNDFFKAESHLAMFVPNPRITPGLAGTWSDLPGAPQMCFCMIGFLIEYDLTCPANIINSGTSADRVDVDDLLAVITTWGPCPVQPAFCPANIVNSGASANRVDVDDLLAVITSWGPCP